MEYDLTANQFFQDSGSLLLDLQGKSNSFTNLPFQDTLNSNSLGKTLNFETSNNFCVCTTQML